MCAHKNRRGIAERMGHPYGIARVKREVKSHSYSIRCGTIKKPFFQKESFTKEILYLIYYLNIPAKNSVLSIL